MRNVEMFRQMFKTETEAVQSKKQAGMIAISIGQFLLYLQDQTVRTDLYISTNWSNAHLILITQKLKRLMQQLVRRRTNVGGNYCTFGSSIVI